jgi:hypothetical protein
MLMLIGLIFPLVIRMVRRSISLVSCFVGVQIISMNAEVILERLICCNRNKLIMQQRIGMA